MSKQDKTSMSGTLVAGSEEDFDVICDPCNNEGQRVQATGHCVDCNENMCISCMKFHRKLAAVKDHVIKDKSTLTLSQKGRTKVNRSAEDKDQMTDRCPKHPDELIKCYCNYHCQLGCTDCISLDHRSCKDILYIKDVSGGVANSDELTKAQTDIQMLVARLTSIQNRTKWIKQTMQDSFSQTVADIRKLKNEIIDMLDQFENEILEKTWPVKEEKEDALNSTISACESAIQEAEEFLTDIEKKKVKGHNNQLFISMKIAQSRILDLADEADKLCDKSNYERLSFQPDEQLNNFRSTLTGLGEIMLVSQSKDVRVEYQHDIKVESDSDTERCGISSIVVLSDGQLAVADLKNMSMKIVDVTKRKVVEQIKLQSKPIDLATITTSEVAVTFQNERHIQVLSVSPALSKSHTIAVPGIYRGIQCIPDRLILVCREPASAVHICDMSGVLLQQIETDYSGNRLFTRASMISVSPEHNVMYVSDIYEDAVVCLTMDGKLISKYTSDRMKVPIGIAVDDNGCAYVCGNESRTVHQLSPSGKLVKVLMVDNDKIFYPFTIAHGAGYLYINNNSNIHEYNNIMVYKLEK